MCMRAKRAKKIAARETQKKILEKKIFKKKTYATKLFLGSRGGAKFNTTWVNGFFFKTAFLNTFYKQRNNEQST